MKKQDNQPTTPWAEEWLESVASGVNTMSQRKLSSIQKQGGLDAVKRIAEKKGVHLVQITDDKGDELVAASVNPFTVIC